jgi:phosphoglycerate dehydrogenase-like enzyme
MNLLVTGAWQDAKQYIEQIEAMGHHAAFQQQEKDRLYVAYDWVEGIIGNGIFLSHPIERFRNLRYIQLTSAGYDRVPMDYVKEHQIEIHNARGVYSIPMAEFAVAGVLQIYKQSRFFYENQKEHRWEKHRGLQELAGKTVTIVGCGSVGTECAKRFWAFGCRVIGIDLYPRIDEHYEQILSMEYLDAILPETDILILTVPLSDETRHLIGLQRLKRLKAGAVLVNIARGAVIDTDALVQSSYRLCGAVLDVFEEEPLDETSPLWDMENMIITPHNSFVGDNNQKRLMRVIIDNLEGTESYESTFDSNGTESYLSIS